MRTVLAGLVFACLLPGLIAAIVFLVHDYREGREEREKDTLQTARALVQAVDSFLLRTQAMGETLATDESLVRGDLEAFRHRAQEALVRTRVATNIILTDQSAQQILNLLAEPGQSLPRSPNPEAIQRVFATGQPVFSDVLVAPLLKRPAVSVFIPVMRGSRVAYVLSVGVLVEQFNGLLQTPGLPPEWVAAIFDSAGTIVARTHAPDQFVGQRGTGEYVERIRQSPEGSMETVTREGIPVLSVYSRSSISHWSVGIGIPSHVFQAGLLRSFSMLALTVIGLFGASLGLAWFLGSMIARSVQGLSLVGHASGTGGVVAPSRLRIKEVEEATALLEERTAALEEANRSLAAREQELSEAHRLAKFGTWYWDIDTDEVRTSDSVREIYGREVPSFQEQRGTLLTVESWERVNGAAQKTIRTGVGYDLELQMRHGGGSTLWINAKAEAVRAPDGKVVALRGTIQDISESKDTQEALHRSMARFQAVFEQAAVGISSADLDGRWLQVNDKLCAIVGYEREELLHHNFREITFFPDLAADQILAQRLLAGEISNGSVEKRYIRKDGRPVWVNVTVTLVRTSDGTPDYYIAVVEDIQPRKEAEAALEAARQTHLQRLEQQVAERTLALREAHDHLEERVAERTEQVRRLAAELTFAEERERQTLARDLHDDLGQLLHVTRIKLGLLGKEDLSDKGDALVEEISSLMADASRQVRSLTSQLSPPILSTLGLPAALRWLCGEIQQTYRLSVSCRAEMAHCRLSSAQAAILFRAARELLINVAKHSGSDRASLELVCESAFLTLAVEDGGVGIPVPDEALAGTKGFGLASIRERISFLGGTMSVDAPAGSGVRVMLRMPLEADKECAKVQ